MRKITFDEDLQELYQKGTGYIYNDYENKHYPFNKLHVSSWRTVRQMDTKTGKYHFNSIDEARDWLEDNRGVVGEDSFMRWGVM